MYDDKRFLTAREILEKDFKIDARGYRPQEVDQFLDLVIKDYVDFEATTKRLVTEIKALESDNAKLKAEIRENIPTEIDGKKVVKVSDYLLKYELDTVTGEKTAIDLPTSNVISFGLEGDNGVIIRPSGTEPKIKAYITAVGKSYNDAESIKDSLVDASKKLLGIE